jgi:hypothetical protein
MNDWNERLNDDDDSRELRKNYLRVACRGTPKFGPTNDGLMTVQIQQQ